MRPCLQYLLDTLHHPPTTSSASKDVPIPDLLNETFLAVDKELFKLAEAEKTHSGCTAVVAFLRIEDDDTSSNSIAKTRSGSSGSVGRESERSEVEADDGSSGGKMAKVKGVLAKIKSSSGSSKDANSTDEPGTEGGVPKVVQRKSHQKRVLYTANVGDARAVIS